MDDATDQPNSIPRARALCPQCNRAPLTPRHCKVICERCGYVESCEDLMPHNQPVILAERTMQVDALALRRFPGARA